MTTFSQVVDELVNELVRPDLRVAIASYLQQTIREVHFSRNTNNPVRFPANRHEVSLTVTDEPYNWPIPNAARFQTIEAAYYRVRGVYANELNPKRVYDRNPLTVDQDVYWYRSGQFISFSGICENEKIDLCYLMYPRRLLFYPSAARPATWNEETQEFTYLPAYDVDDTSREAARDLVTHWLLQGWSEVLKQGVRAKTFSRVGDVERARLSYSLFESQRDTIQNSETWNDL